MFYQTHTNQGISEIGVVESSHKDLSLEDIIKTVGKRSVFSQEELKEFEDKNSILLFIHSREFYKIPSKKLIKMGLIKRAPMTAHNVNNEKYSEFKKLIQ